MGDNEWPTAVVYQLPPGIESFYDSDVQTGNIEKKTNQSMECLDIILLFLYIQVLTSTFYRSVS